MRSSPARKMTGSNRPHYLGVVKAGKAVPHQLHATSRAALVVRLDLIKNLPNDELPDRLFCPEVLMYNFETDRSGITLRELLHNKYIEGSNFISLEHLDRLKAKLAQMTPAKAKTINYSLLCRINEAVRLELGPTLFSPADEVAFTPRQYRQRVRALSSMIASPLGYQIAGQLVPLRILLKRKSVTRALDPVAALQDLSAELAIPDKKKESEYIILDDQYLKLFQERLAIEINLNAGKFGFDRLKEINRIVQEQFRAYQEYKNARQEKRPK